VHYYWYENVVSVAWTENLGRGLRLFQDNFKLFQSVYVSHYPSDISCHTPCTRVQCVSLVIHYLPSVSEVCFFFLYVCTSLVTRHRLTATLHRHAQQSSVSSQLGNSDSLNSLTSRKIQTRFSEIWHSFSGTSLLR